MWLPSESEAGVIRPGIVHRLDKGTTGLLVAAKDAQTLAALAEQFKAHTVRPLALALFRFSSREWGLCLRALKQECGDVRPVRPGLLGLLARRVMAHVNIAGKLDLQARGRSLCRSRGCISQ